MLRSLAILTLVFLVFAGCSGPARRAETGPSQPAEADPYLGGIEGTVTDDQILPLTAVEVAIDKYTLTTSTDELGHFRFVGLQPGEYVLAVAKAGYRSVAKRTLVEAGDLASIAVQLEPLPTIGVPWNYTNSKVAQIHVGWYYATLGLWSLGVNQSEYNRLVCDPCQFQIPFQPVGMHVIRTELLLKAGMQNAAMNKEAYIRYNKNDSAGTYLFGDFMEHRENKTWGAYKPPFVGATRLYIAVAGAVTTIQHEMRVELFTTIAYHGDLPRGFSALPPP